MFGNFNVGVENLQPLHATNSDKKALTKAALIKDDIFCWFNRPRPRQQ